MICGCICHKYSTFCWSSGAPRLKGIPVGWHIGILLRICILEATPVPDFHVNFSSGGIKVLFPTRLDTFGKWIGVATLRTLEVGGVPEELQAEPVNRKVLFAFITSPC